MAAGDASEIDKSMLDGELTVPASLKAVTAYYDANGSGEYEKLAEPGVPCVLSNAGWRCSLQSSRIVAHRIAFSGDEAAVYALKGDALVVGESRLVREIVR